MEGLLMYYKIIMVGFCIWQFSHTMETYREENISRNVYKNVVSITCLYCPAKVYKNELPRHMQIKHQYCILFDFRFGIWQDARLHAIKSYTQDLQRKERLQKLKKQLSDEKRLQKTTNRLESLNLDTHVEEKKKL
jgi:hypothetical protein